MNQLELAIVTSASAGAILLKLFPCIQCRIGMEVLIETSVLIFRIVYIPLPEVSVQNLVHAQVQVAHEIVNMHNLHTQQP